MMWDSTRRAAVAVVALAVGAGVVASLPSAHATPKVTTGRYGGSDRFATAQALAEHAFASGASTAVLARGEDFPDGTKGFADALAGNYLAGFQKAPILLTDGDSVPAATLQAFKDLKVKNVAILGGTSAVSSTVETQLDATPSTNAAGGDLVTARVAGADRYATAADLVEALPSSYIGTINGLPTALIAGGDDFPDALAGGPLADAAHLPLLLTNPQSLSAATAQALQAEHIKAALILGGTSAVSAADEQAIQALGITTERLAGSDRQATAVVIARYAIAYLRFKDTLVDLARGDSYPDALAGGPEAAATGPYPIVLTSSPTVLGPETAGWLQSVNGTLSEVDALGLQSAVSDAVLAQAAGDATCTLPSSGTTVPGGAVLTTILGLLPGGATTTAPTSTTGPAGPCNSPSTTAAPSTTGGPTTTSGGPTTTGTGSTLPIPTTLPGGVTLPTLPVTLPTLPVTIPGV